MERWELRADPSASDPRRHMLLLKGGMSDVTALIKKFGTVCGRPTPLKDESFDLKLALHRLTPELRGSIEAWLTTIAPPIKKEAAPDPVEIRAAPKAPPEIELAAPAPTIRIEDPVAPPVPPAPAPEPTPKPIVISVQPAPVAPRASPPLSAPGAMLLTEALQPGWTFETLLVGAYNRFAHAAAMSVVSSPGQMHNPLFLYGQPGTGKSHLLHAVAAAMLSGGEESSLIVTSGSRLSRAVGDATARKQMAGVDARMASAKAIFVDDIHLMMVTEQNRDALAGIFKSFFDRGLQVVITSLYPPRSLGALEEALKFSFSKGWSVDLKIPAPSMQKDHVASVCDRLGASFSGDEIQLLHERLSQWGYSDLSLWVKRLTALRRRREKAQVPSALTDMLRLIYEPLVGADADGGEIPNSTLPFTPPAAAADAQTIAILSPGGPIDFGRFAASRFYDLGARNGFPETYRHVLWETYDEMQQVGVPFQIADLFQRGGASRALVVGPSPQSPLAPREAEFAHAVRRILESVGASVGWIPYKGIQLPAHYLNAHLDYDWS